jgi:dolichol kinase
MSPYVLFSFAGVAILVVTLLIEFAVRNNWLDYFLGRKLLHVIAIGTTAWIIDKGLESHTLGMILVASGILLIGVLVQFKWGLQQESSYGIALFPISLGGLLMLGTPAAGVATAAWVLAVSDASAGWVGRQWGSPKYIFLSESKSYQGALAFFITALICMGIRFPDLHIGWWILFSILPTLTELFSWRGSDNFFLPIFTVAWIQLLLNTPHLGSWIWILVVAILFIFLAWIVLHKQWLDQTGLWAAVWMAAMLWMSGGWKALSAPIFLLVAGSFAGRLFHAKHSSDKRTAQQVFSNGWIGVVCYMLYGLTDQFHWQLFAWCSFAISICDTISSEVGTAIGGKTFNVTNFRVMKPGLSGGISVAGTVGGFIALSLIHI